MSELMSWGLQNRIASIIKPHNNRALMLAVDHGYFLGPTERLEDAKKTITPLLRYCDSLMLTRGVQRNCVDPTTNVPMVLRVSGGTSIIGEDLSQEDITVSIDDAIRLNASALAMSMFIGSKYEYQTVVNLGRLVNEAERYGIPVLAVTAVGKDMGKDARYLSLACRMAAEQGAHIVKTYYCDNFEKVVNSCPVPIIVAGGKKIPERDAMQLTHNAIRGGAVGVDMGRNIWQSDHPVAMIRAIHSIVHNNNTVDAAYSLYQELAKESPSGSAKSTRPNNQNKSNHDRSRHSRPNSKRPRQNNPRQNNSKQNNSKHNNPRQNNQKQNRNQNNSKQNPNQNNPKQNIKQNNPKQNPTQNPKPNSAPKPTA